MNANGATVPTVLIVDDSEVVRMKLRGLLNDAEGMELVGEAADGQTGLTLARALQPEVVVMDLRMPGMSGIEATWKLGTEAPASRVLVLTVSSEQDDVTDAIMAGAFGYVVKGAGDEEILGAIRRVAAGERAISHELAGSVVGRVRGEEPHAPAPEPEPEPAPVPMPEPDPEPEPEPVAAPRRPVAPSRPPPPLGWVLAIGLSGGLIVTAIGQGQAILDGADPTIWTKVLLNFVVTLGIAGLAVAATRID